LLQNATTTQSRLWEQNHKEFQRAKKAQPRVSKLPLLGRNAAGVFYDLVHPDFFADFHNEEKLFAQKNAIHLKYI
jgi:SOS-response transcriptional repressor LexA